MTAHSPPSQLSLYRAFFAVSRDDALAYPVSFVFQQLSLLALVIPFFFISEYLVGTNDYFEFVIVGLTVSNLLNAGLVDVGESIQALINRGTFEFILTQPIRWHQVPFAVLWWPLLVRAGVSCVLLTSALLLGVDLHITQPLLLAGILLFSIVASLAVGVMGLAVRIQTKRSDPFTTAYWFGLWLFSGIYFPVTSLPDFLQPVAWLFPHAFAIDAIRALTVPSAETALASPSTSLAILVMYSVVGGPIALYLFNRSFAVGRRSGGLTAY